MIKLLLLPIKIALLPFKLLLPRGNKDDDNIWGLSKEDKRIAKSERMSDAEYIEAEERDDDELDDDDW